MSALTAVRYYRKTYFFIDIGCKDRTLQCSRRHRGSQEKSLIKIFQNAKGSADFLAQPRRGQTVCRIFHTFFLSSNISADRSQSASGVLDERSYDHIRTHVGRFYSLHEFSVAVIHHADHVRLNTFNEGDQFADPLYGQGGSGLVALGSLNRYQMSFLIDILTDFIVIKASVRQQIHLAISHTVFCQRSLRRADTDDFFQRIIGFAYRGQQFVSRS